jgi:hypothetical protein
MMTERPYGLPGLPASVPANHDDDDDDDDGDDDDDDDDHDHDTTEVWYGYLFHGGRGCYSLCKQKHISCNLR